MRTSDGPLPLEGVRVLDLTHIIAGPFCAAILADYGAEVIKVEPPGRGDRARTTNPFIERDGARVSSFFYALNRNRRSVALNLKAPWGRRAFLELVAVGDVLLENFSPGTLEKLGLGYEELRRVNPSLVHVAISGYGQLPPYLGPYASWQANNATAQAMSGLMELTGEPEGPPVLVGATIGDTIPGLWAALSTLVALEHRRRTGRGQFVDVAMYDALAAMCFKALTDYHVTGVAPTRGREGWHTTFTTRLRCRDGYIAVSMWGIEGRRWERLWQRIGREEVSSHPDFDATQPGSPRSFPLVKRVLEEWLAGVDRWEAVRTLLEMGFSAGAVQNAEEVYHCPHLAARQLFMEVEDGIGGTLRTPGTPARFSGFTPPPPRRAPHLGEHTEQVLTELLGYGAAEVARVRQEGEDS